MQIEIWLLAVPAALASAPVAAQSNLDEPVNSAANQSVATDANLVTDTNVVMTAPAENAIEPAPAPTTTESAPALATDEGSRGFPWGLLGILGLIGLLGRRRG